MASFLERQPAQFTPYQSQLPDGYAQLGAMQQDKYGIGIEKVNSYIQSLSGLDVVREADRKYLDNKINTLTSDVNKIAGSTDWSNQAISNQVGALASKIYSDPNVQNAVAGTVKYKRTIADIGEAKKSGKGYSVQNEWDTLSSVQGWLNDPTPGAAYTGKSFTPYVDVNAKAQDYLKNVKPNWIIESNPMSPINGEDGTPIAYQMVNNKKEYIDPNEVKRVLASTLQPEDYNQLDINGRYSGRMYTDPVVFKSQLERQQNYTVRGLQSQIDAWKDQVQKNQGDPSAVSQLNTLIQRNQKEIENANRTFNSYRSAIDNGNMEGVKSQMYINDWLEGWGQSLGYTKEETSYQESPVFKAIMEVQKEKRAFEKDARDYQLSAAKTKSEIEVNDAKIRELNAKGVTSSGVPLGGAREVGISTEVVNNLAGNFYNETLNQLRAVEEGSTRMMYDYFGETYGWDSEKLNSLFNVERQGDQVIIKPKKGKENELELAKASIMQSYSENPSNVSKSMQSYINNLHDLSLVANARMKQWNKANKEADQQFPLAPILNSVGNTTLTASDGTIYVYSPEDLTKIYEKGYVSPQASRPGIQSFGSIPMPNTAKLASAIEKATDPREKAALEALQRGTLGQTINNQDAQLISNIDKIGGLYRTVNERVNQRRNFITEKIRPAVEVRQSSRRPISTGNTEEVRVARSVAQTSFNDLRESAGGKLPKDFDSDKFSELIKDPNTTYEIQQNPDGSGSILLSNVEVSQEGISIPVTSSTMSNRGLTTPDKYDMQRQLLGVNRTPTGRAYTGLTKEEAFNLPVQLSKYSVKYTVEQSPNAGYSANLYVYDKNSKAWVRDNGAPLVISGFANLDALNQSLSNTSVEQLIDVKLQETQGYK